MSPPFPGPTTTTKAIHLDSTQRLLRNTVVTSVKVGVYDKVYLCEVSLSIWEVTSETFAHDDIKARPCIGWFPEENDLYFAGRHSFKLSYSDTKSVKCDASVAVVPYQGNLVQAQGIILDEGVFKDTLLCSVEEDQAVRAEEVEVFTIPIGQGDSTVIKCPGEKGDISIIDMGCLDYLGTGCQSMSVEKYVEEIERQFLNFDYSRLKRVFLTHPDEDHLNYGYSGSGEGLLEKWSKWYQVQTGESKLKLDVYLGNFKTWNDNQESFVKDLEEEAKGFNPRWHQKGVTSDWSDFRSITICGFSPHATIEIVASDLGHSKDGKNDRSMVMSLRMKNRRKMLFLGDFEKSNAYNNLLFPTHPSYDPITNPNDHKYVKEIGNHQIVAVPHHGSNNNGNPNARFYNEVNPTFAIVSSAMISTKETTKFPKIETLQAICNGHTVAVNAEASDDLLPIGWATYNPNCPKDDSDDSIYIPDCSEEIRSEPIESLLQNLLYCDVHIYQTSKPNVNKPYGLQSYMIVTRISATNTMVTAYKYD